MKHRRELAIHEAGHAVVGWMHGELRFSRIVIGDGRAPIEGDALGYVESKYRLPRPFCGRMKIGRPEPKDWPKVRDIVVGLIAGTAAQWHLRGRKGRVWLPGSESDIWAAQNLADRLHGGDNDLGVAFVHYCVEISKVEVARHWWAIEAVADALASAGEMRFPAFQGVLAAAADRRWGSQAALTQAGQADIR